MGEIINGVTDVDKRHCRQLEARIGLLQQWRWTSGFNHRLATGHNKPAYSLVTSPQVDHTLFGGLSPEPVLLLALNYKRLTTPKPAGHQSVSRQNSATW